MSNALVIAELIPEPLPETPSGEHVQPDDLAKGQWYWVTTSRWNGSGHVPHTWLGCITHLGTNYANLEEPVARKGYGNLSVRVHFDTFYQSCVWVPNANEIIAGYVAHHQSRVNVLMGKMQQVVAQLAISPSREMVASGADTQALSVSLSGKTYGDYKAELVKAKTEELPLIFAEIKSEHELLAKWMSASLLPLQAEVGTLEHLKEKVTDRIFTVELYAGLVEEIVQVRKGAPATLDTPLTLIQRRHYMDEECLARYEVGGMQMSDIRDFDRWISKPENMKRLLPFERCMVAFKVRRRDIQRECHGLLAYLQLWQEREEDARTFLYIRNGQQLFRMCTGIDFGEQLFPDMGRELLDGKKLWAVMKYEDIKEVITDDDQQVRVAEYDKEEADFEASELVRTAACEAAPEKEKYKYRSSDHPFSHKRHFGANPHNNRPFNRSDVYYDDVGEFVQKQLKAHNRVALIVQGLLDRSTVLHPHPPWQIWTKEGYEQGLRLVYDETRALTTGAAPDFEAYRKRLNATLRVCSLTVGQRAAWEESERLRRYRDDPRRYLDPGPSRIAEVERFNRSAGTCFYVWERDAERGNWVSNPDDPGYRKFVQKHVKVKGSFSVDEVLNVDAYTPGDFRQFFDDPRTRADYLKWAPLLLACEEYHAGNRTGAPPWNHD